MNPSEIIFQKSKSNHVNNNYKETIERLKKEGDVVNFMEENFIEKKQFKNPTEQGDYAEKILVHGDPDIMPLYSDRRRQANSVTIINDLSDKLHYTGYVCDESMPLHKKKNNIIYVSTGLNKEEGLLLFKYLLPVAKDFKNYTFIMTVANRYISTKTKQKNNVIMAEYIPNLRNKLIDCSAYITYGGYNATVEILKSRIPSIIIPRQDGQKMEQFIRAYTFEPYNFYKVVNSKELLTIGDTLKDVLNNKPKKFKFKLNGATESANVIKKIHYG